jgi:hypothetical protein
MGRYSDQYDWYECEWCRVRGNWERRPCLLKMGQSPDLLRMKWEACELVRMGNAAKRNKTLPKGHGRAMSVVAAKAKVKEFRKSSLGANIEAEVGAHGLSKLYGGTPVEVGGKMETGTATATEPVPAASKATSKPKHHHEIDANKAQHRQAKSCTGPEGMIDEGVSLASDDGDVARIHAANRKAWPRGQEPIASDATAEDREIAELVRRGFISAEDLRVDHDDFGGDMCPYTVRFVEARKKGARGNNRRGQGVTVAEPVPLEAESDWWYLDDEEFAQLLSDGATELVDWSEASSFVHVD